MTVVVGHGLLCEGAAFRDGSCTTTPCAGHLMHRHRVRWNSVGGPGHALCACGVLSPHLPSAAQRRAWHRAHKQDVPAG